MLIIHVWYAQLTSQPSHKVIQLTALLSNSKHFFIQHFVGHWPANTIWWWENINSFMWLLTMISSIIDLRMNCFMFLGYMKVSALLKKLEVNR